MENRNVKHTPMPVHTPYVYLINRQNITQLDKGLTKKY